MQWQWVNLNLNDLFAESHPLAKFFSIVKKLDLSEFDENYENDSGKGGGPAIPPDRMLALIFYSILYGNISMRHLERDLRVRADLMYLSGGLQIDHSTISIFRTRHAKAIENLFTQTVFLGVESGMIDLDTICIDSTKIKANANRRDIGTQEELSKRYKAVEETCAKRYQEWKESEDPDGKLKLQEKLEQAEKQKEKLANGIEFLKANKERKRVHLNEPDADWHKDGGSGFVVGYSAQTAVDSKSKMIVFQKVVTSQADASQTVMMVNETDKIAKEIAGEAKPKYVLDAGYPGEANLETLFDKDLYIPDADFVREFGGKTKPENREVKETGINFTFDQEKDFFVCPEGKTLSFTRERDLHGKLYREYRTAGCSSCPLREKCAGTNRKDKTIMIPKSLHGKIQMKTSYPPGSQRRSEPQGPLTVKMREKLSTKEGKAIYAKRFPTIEGTFGVMKSVRNGWQFLRKGLDRVQTEWTERSMAHNIAKLSQFTQLAM
jgi:transposase